MKNALILVMLSTSFLSCQNNDYNVQEVERAFYYWKGNYIGNENVSQLKKLQVGKLYFKLFEIDYSEAQGNFPYCKNKPHYSCFKELDAVKIVPTIFVKNEIFEFNDEKSLDKLADNIVFLINKYSSQELHNGSVEKVFDYDEIQIDCDWTKSSKEKYFYLLQKIKELSKKKLSCTLRLYPYKYPDIMGVPPVDKATLMCYNLIKPLSQQDKNSILDIDELKKYLNEKKSYPVHLDIALPTFYWTQLYQNNRFTKLVDLNTNEVKSFAKLIEPLWTQIAPDTSRLTKQIELSTEEVENFAKLVKPLWYQVERDTSIDDEIYLRAGDELKCEEVSAEMIYKAIKIIKKYVELEENITISLFDLDKSTFNQYSNEEISNFYSNFTK